MRKSLATSRYFQLLARANAQTYTHSLNHNHSIRFYWTISGKCVQICGNWPVTTRIFDHTIEILFIGCYKIATEKQKHHTHQITR